MSEITISYDVRVVGRSWQPGFTCSDHITVKPESIRDDVPVIDAIQQYADTHLPDFASVDAFDIRLVEQRSSFSRTADGWECSVREQRFTQLSSFSDEEEDLWNSGYGDDSDD